MLTREEFLLTVEHVFGWESHADLALCLYDGAQKVDDLVCVLRC